MSEVEHVAVLLRETIELLAPRSGGRYVDGTLGAGGHAEAVLEASSPDGELLGIDWDADARDRAARRLARFGERVHIRAGAFPAIGEEVRALGWDGADGILVDLGVSSMQLEVADRGFSFSRRGPLDMRMDRSRTRDLASWLATVDEEELVRVLREYGEEPHARRVARAILAAEESGALTDTIALAETIAAAAGRAVVHHHPATRTFQALRIAVNEELEMLHRFLADSWQWLRPGGRMVMIAYHSLEDRMVKQTFQLWSRNCLCPRGVPVCRCGWSKKVVPLTRRPVRPSANELRRNPRSRSARLRAVERIAA